MTSHGKYTMLIDFIRKWYKTDEFIPLHMPRFHGKDKEYVADAIDSTFVSSVGKYVTQFEHEFAKLTGAEYAIAVVNGTTALQAALRLAGVGKGHEVITQPLTFVATVNAIIHNGAEPVFVDVDRETMGMCPNALEQFLDENYSRKETGVFNRATGRALTAIVPMHTFGFPCSMDKIMEIADSWGINVVEDSAEALGSEIHLKHCGTFGRMGIFSFNGNKIITCGGGGAIVTNDKDLAVKAKHLTTTAKTEHAWDYVHDETGYNFRMPNLNAALACAQLTRFENILADKRQLSNAYGEFFRKADYCKFVTEEDGCTSNYWLNTVITRDRKERDELLKTTNNAGIMTRPAWQLMTKLGMYRKCQKGDLNNALWLRKRIVNLPSSARENV